MNASIVIACIVEGLFVSRISIFKQLPIIVLICAGSGS